MLGQPLQMLRQASYLLLNKYILDGSSSKVSKSLSYSW